MNPKIVIACLAAWPATSAASGVPETKVVVGDGAASPEAAGLTWWTRATLNDNGDVALVAFEEASGGVRVVEADGTVRTVASYGEASPGGGSGFEEFGLLGVSLDNAGDVAFFAELDSGAEGLYLGRGGALSTVAEDGQVLPGASAPIVRVTFPFPDFTSGSTQVSPVRRPTLSDNGLVTATPFLGGGPPAFSIIRGNGLAPTKTLATWLGATPTGGTWTQLSSASLTASGEAIFYGTRAEASGAVTGYFRETATGFDTIIALAPDGTPGREFFNVPQDGPLISNNLGILYATAGVDMPGTMSLSRVILRADANGTSVIARQGDSYSNTLDVIGAPIALAGNDAGQSVFASAEGSSAFGAIGRAGDDGVLQIARTGQAAPGGNGVFGNFFESGIDFDPQASINDAGQVVFPAKLQQTASGDADDVGLFFFDDRLGLLTVARDGDLLNDETLTLVLSENGQSGSGANTDAFNENGQVAFNFLTAEGSQGVAVWTPPSIDDLLPGDATLDGVVDLADFNVLRNNFGSDFQYFTTGDFDGDGLVNLADFNLLRNHFGGSAADWAVVDAWRATVPEPAGLGVAIVGGLLVCRRRR
jgi:hypothetical protein